MYAIIGTFVYYERKRDYFMSNIIILAAIILYLGMVVWIGVICSKKNSDVGDFYLGGRKLGPVVTAMSAEASDMSSYLLMGVPGLAYLTGLADATWTAIGLHLVLTLTGLLLPRNKIIFTWLSGNNTS